MTTSNVYKVFRWGTLLTSCFLFLSCVATKPCFFACVTIKPSPSKSRIALVVGNADYNVIRALNNPVNDAKAMSKVLGDLDFEVIYQENANKQMMETAIKNFEIRLKEARQQHKKTVGLFYYSGHGAQNGDENFLLPVGLKSSYESPNSLLESETVALSSVLNSMKKAQSTMNIIILDACRNKPNNLMLVDASGKTKSIPKGLAWIDNTDSPDSSAPEGTFIAYATSPKKEAYDDGGKNSPYTKYLLEHIHERDLSIEKLFKKVRQKVIKETGGKQTPWESSSLKGDFSFKKIKPMVPIMIFK